MDHTNPVLAIGRGKQQIRGQVMPVTLLLLVFIVTLALHILRTGEIMHRKVAMQIAADATAISAARVQARALNALALLNQQLKKATTLSKAIIATWTSLAACAAACSFIGTCGCKALLAQFTPRARRALKFLQRYGDSLAATQDKIIADNPKLVVTISHLIATENGARVAEILHHTTAYASKPTLRVHRKGKTTFANGAACRGEAANACPTTRKSLSGNFKLPGLLQLDDDFFEKQQLAIVLKRGPPTIDIETIAQAVPLYMSSRKRFDLLHAKWDAKLQPVSLKDDFRIYH